MFSHDTLQTARALFPYTSQGRIYLNHAATGPLSTRVVEAMSEYLRERSEGVLETYQEDIAVVAECRSLVQRIINAESPDRIAFQANTSDALNVVAAGFPWKPGDRVLLNSVEFPANVYPYLNLRRHGVELDFIRPDQGIITTEMIASAITPRTRLVALSAVQFLSGHRADLAAIGDLCRSKGIVFAVDGIQAVGAVTVDVQRMKIDTLSTGCQKWQMGPHGTAFLYLTDDLQSRLHQASLGWLSVADPWKFYNYEQPLASSARRYEGGSPNMPGLRGLHAALGTILEFGTRAIEDQVLALTDILLNGLAEIGGITPLTPLPAKERAGIVTVQPAGTLDPKSMFEALAQRGITIALREGKLRYSPHFYNTVDEMETTVHITRECLHRS